MNNPRSDGPERPFPRPPMRRARTVSGDGIFRVLRTWLLLSAMAMAEGSLVAGQTQPAVQQAVRSPDLHYLVSGLASGENLHWVGRLEAQEAAVEKWVGRDVPFAGQPPIAVSFRTRAEGMELVVRVQGWEDGRFLQRLAATGTWGVDGDDFAEAACWLLLNRLAAESTPADLRFGMGAEAPDWLACGLAQVCDGGARARNRSWIAKEWREGRSMALAEVVKLGRMPTGQWREKAYAGAAVEFLFPSGDAAAWQAAFDALGRRETLDPRWLRTHCGALAGKNPEAEWSAWLARLAAGSDAAVAGREDRALAQEALLMDVLTVHPREIGPDVPEGIPEEVYAGELVSWRGQEWCVRVAGNLQRRVQELAPGSPPELREALSGYAAFFVQLGNPPKPKKHWWQRSGDDSGMRPPDDAAWVLALNQLWQRAEGLHRDFLEGTLARKRYVDGWDIPLREVMPDSGEMEVPRTPIQRYMDGMEAVF